MDADDGFSPAEELKGLCWGYEAAYLQHYSPDEHSAFAAGCEAAKSEIEASR